MALCILLFGFGTWATFTTLSGAIIANGQVAVDRNRQVVQHPDGGVVANINVSEGQTVAQGDILLRLDDTGLRSELAGVQGQLHDLMARRARLLAERDGLDAIALDTDLQLAMAQTPSVAGMINGQRRLFAARRLSHRQALDQLGKRKGQIAAQISGMQAQKQAVTTQHELLGDELKNQQDLLQRGLAQAGRVLALRRDHAELSGQLGQLQASIAQAQGRMTEIDLEMLRLDTQQREDAITQLRDLEFRLASLRETHRGLTARLDRMTITAPVGGRVYGLAVFAQRAVIRPADPILYIIPQNRPLVVAARVDPMHVDQVFVGQNATLRLSGFDQRSTPELAGVVGKLSADAFYDEGTGVSYYRAEVLLNPGELSKLPAGKTLIPGMPVESFLRTQDRSPLTYLINPLSDYFAKAMRES